jgi:hypothetical protein
MTFEPLYPAYVFRELDRSYGSALNEINRGCPVVADFTFYFDRGGNFFAWPDSVFDAGYRYIGMFCDEELVGYGMIGLHSGNLGAELGPFLYLGDWRILPGHRGHSLGLQGAEALAVGLPEEVNLGYCLVKSGNAPVEWILRTEEAEHWTVERLCGFTAVNLLFLFKPVAPRYHEVRRATPADAAAMADTMQRAWDGMLFAPPPQEAREVEHDLEQLTRTGDGAYYLAFRGGRLAGLLRVWDATAIKRTTVLAYSRRANMLRAAYAGARRLFAGHLPPLPRRGGSFRSLTLHRAAVPDRDPAVLRDLLFQVLRDYQGRGYHLAHLGFTEDDPLRPAARWLPAQRFESELHLITRRGEELRDLEPWVDIARI